MQQFSYPRQEVSISDYLNLQKERDALREEVERLNTRVTSLESYIRWERKLFANTSLQDSHKLDIIALKRYIDTHPTEREDGLTDVSLAYIAKMNGRVHQDGKNAGKPNPKSTGQHFMVLGDSGVVRRDFKRGGDGDGVSSTVSLSLSEEVMSAPDRLQLAKDRNGHGGKRIVLISPCCHKEMVKQERVYRGICPQCGTQHVLNPKNPDHKPFIVDEETAGSWEENYQQEAEPIEEEQEARREPIPLPVARTIKNDPPARCRNCGNSIPSLFVENPQHNKWQCMSCYALAYGHVHVQSA